MNKRSIRTRKKTLCLYFINVEHVHLGKDVFLTPYYLGKELGYDVSIVYPQTETNKDLPEYYRGVRFKPLITYEEGGKNIVEKIKQRLRYIKLWLGYLRRQDVLMLFHYYYRRNVYQGILYKLLNPFGRLYVKLDADVSALKREDNYKNIFQKYYWNLMHALFAKLVDCVTCETTLAYDFIMNTKATCYKFRDQMFIMPNAFDEEYLYEHPLRIKSFNEKQNLFITCGRIGTEQKNTEMLLKALNIVNLKDWKFKIIGPYPEEFQSQIDFFFQENPDKKGKVEFVGNISDKMKIYAYFNDCKVLTMTSRFEGSPLVFIEANYFRDFILSTNVGSFYDVTEGCKYGCEVDQENYVFLAEKIQEIVDGKMNVNVYSDNFKGITWSRVVKPVAQKLKDN